MQISRLDQAALADMFEPWFSQSELSVYKKRPFICLSCARVCSIRMVRRGGSQTTAAWISLRWSGKTKMTLYVHVKH